MSTTPSQIDLWLASPSETRKLEFKEAKTQFGREKLFKYCVAIANEGGGHLLLGVTDAKPRRVVGTSAFGNPVAMESEIFNTLGFRVDIEEVAHPEGRVLVFQIPGRPLGTAYAYEGVRWMRVGEELRQMSDDRLRQIFAEGRPSWLDQPATKEISGQDVVGLLDTQAYFDLLELPYPTTQEAVLARLAEERLILSQPEGYTITNLAAVLLAKNLRNFETVYRKAPRVVSYKADSKLETISDVHGEKGYAVGFQGLVRHIMSQLPQNELIQDALRKESKLLPELVIRELVANALIHQDFELTGASPMVEIYSNRVEISNPGEPIVPVDRFIDGYQSRNERLADLMRRFRICEEKSSGVDRVVETAEIHQLPAPEFTVALRRTVVVIHGPRPFSKMDGNDRVRACYQHCALQWVLRRQMTNQSLRNRFGLADGSSNTASQIISAAQEQGLIKLDPSAPTSKKYARYLPSWA